MIALLIEWMAQIGIKLPLVFSNASFRMVIAAMTSMSITVVFGKRFIASLCALKIGHKMRVSDVAVLAADYKKSEDVPSMGGVLFILSVLSSVIFWIDLTHSFSYILILTMLWMGALGALDDYLKLKGVKEGVSPKGKMLSQLILGGLLSAYLLVPAITDSVPLKAPRAREHLVVNNSVMKEVKTKEYALRYFIPFIKKPIVLPAFMSVGVFLFSLFVISGSANAVNLTDGLDGLASGLVMLSALVLAIVAFLSNNIELARYLNILYIEGASEIGIFLSALCGALLGFLWYNAYPAQVFMGDTGSLALGGVLGVAAILLRREFLLALVGGVFVIETLSVIIQMLSYRFRNKKRVFLCAPIHHHFQMKGWHETKVVIRFWIVGLLFALLGVASLKFQ